MKNIILLKLCAKTSTILLGKHIVKKEEKNKGARGKEECKGRNYMLNLRNYNHNYQ